MLDTFSGTEADACTGTAPVPKIFVGNPTGSPLAKKFFDKEAAQGARVTVSPPKSVPRAPISVIRAPTSPVTESSAWKCVTAHSPVASPLRDTNYERAVSAHGDGTRDPGTAPGRRGGRGGVGGPNSVPRRPNPVPRRPDSVPRRPDSVPRRPDSVPRRPDSVPRRPDSVPRRPDS
eukprot:gene14541-biopygen177